METNTFRQEVYTFQITAEQSNTSDTVSDNNECSCTKGTNGKMGFYPTVAKWSDANCGLMVFLNKSEKQLFDKQITNLLTMKKTQSSKVSKAT